MNGYLLIFAVLIFWGFWRGHLQSDLQSELRWGVIGRISCLLVSSHVLLIYISAPLLFSSAEPLRTANLTSFMLQRGVPSLVKRLPQAVFSQGPLGFVAASEHDSLLTLRRSSTGLHNRQLSVARLLFSLAPSTCRFPVWEEAPRRLPQSEVHL